MSKYQLVKLIDTAKTSLAYGSGASAIEYNGKVRYIRITDINDNGKLCIDKVSPSEFDEKYIINDGDILFARSGATVGKTYLHTEDNGEYVYAGYLIRYIPNKEMVDPRYVYYYTKSSRYLNFIHLSQRAVAQPNINAKQYSEMLIPYYSKDIQKHIADILDKTQEIIDGHKKQLEELDNLIKATFYEMFGDPVVNEKGWKVAKIKDYFMVKTGSTPSRGCNQYWDDGTIPWIKTTEIKENCILECEEYITELATKECRLTKLPIGALLVAMYGQGQTRGRTAKLMINATINQACAALIKKKNDVNVDFIWHYLMISYEKLRSLGRGGNQPNLNKSLVENFDIVVPDIQLQNKFAQIVTNIEEQKFIVKQCVTESQNLFNSLMNEYFG